MEPRWSSRLPFRLKAVLGVSPARIVPGNAVADYPIAEHDDVLPWRQRNDTANAHPQCQLDTREAGLHASGN